MVNFCQVCAEIKSVPAINTGNKHKKVTYSFSIKRFDEELQWSLWEIKREASKAVQTCTVLWPSFSWCVCVEVSQGWRAPLRQVLLLSSHCHAKGTSCLHSAMTAEIFTTLFTRDTLTDRPTPPKCLLLLKLHPTLSLPVWGSYQHRLWASYIGFVDNKPFEWQILILSHSNDICSSPQCVTHYQNVTGRFTSAWAAKQSLF